MTRAIYGKCHFAPTGHRTSNGWLDCRACNPRTVAPPSVLASPPTSLPALPPDSSDVWEMNHTETHEFLVERVGVEIANDWSQSSALARESDDADIILALYRRDGGSGAIENENCPTEVLHDALAGEDMELWGVVSGASNVDEFCVERILTHEPDGDEFHDTRLAVARTGILSNPHTPMDALIRLHDENHADDVRALASNPSLPRELFETYLGSENVDVRKAAFGNPGVPIDLLGKAARKESSVECRVVLSLSRRLSVESRDMLVERTLRKWHPRVAYALVARADVPVEQKFALLTHGDARESSRAFEPYGAFRRGFLSDDDFRAIMTFPNRRMHYTAVNALAKESGRRILELTGVDPRNKPALKHLRELYGDDWWHFTPESPEIRLALLTHGNL